MNGYCKTKLFLLSLLAVILLNFALADTECTNGDCSLDISINVVESANGNFSGSVRGLSGGLLTDANVAVLGTFYSTVTATGECRRPRRRLERGWRLPVSARGHSRDRPVHRLPRRAVRGTGTCNIDSGAAARVHGLSVRVPTPRGILRQSLASDI